MSRTRWQRKAPDFYWNREQIAWVAGLIEGEGTIRTHKTRPSQAQEGITYAYPMVSVQMTDEDVVRRAQEWTGLGRVLGPYNVPSRPGSKPIWMWHVMRKDQAMTLIAMVWAYLGERRREQARRTLGAFSKGTGYVTN